MDKTLGQIALESIVGKVSWSPFPWRMLNDQQKSDWEAIAAAVAAAVKEEDARICEALGDCGPDNGCCPTYWNEALDRAELAIRASIKEVK